MTKTRDLLKKIQTLFSREQYRRALKEVERSGPELLAAEGSSREHQDLLLLVGNIYYANRKYKETYWYLSELENRYPGIDENPDFVVLRLKMSLKKGHIAIARKMLDEWYNRASPDERFPLLDFFSGVIHVRSHNYIEASCCFQNCYRRFTDVSDPTMLGNTLYMLGYMALQKALYVTAERYFTAAVEMFELADRSLVLGTTHRMICIAATRMGKFDEAMRHVHTAMACYKRCSDRHGIISAQLVRARVLICCDEHGGAERLLRGVLRAARKIGYARGAVQAGILMGEVLCLRRTPSEALLYLKETEKYIALSAMDNTTAAYLYRIRGEALLALDMPDDAEPVLMKSLGLARGSGDRRAIGLAMRALGRWAAQKDDIIHARVYLDESITYLEGAGDTHELLSAYIETAEVYTTWGTSGDIPLKCRMDHLFTARDYVTRASRICPLQDAKSAALCETLARRIESAIRCLESGPRYRKIHFDSSALHHGMLVAQSKHMKGVVEKVRDLAPSTVPILITGETGTGKEVVARLIHRLSNRSDGPFIAVNCAAIPDTVFESELFGHKRGSFTGAFRDKKGLVEQASGGTIFLDEISELSNLQQAKLLRALQDGLIRRIGETVERPIDIRVISASNEDIEVLMRSGRLRDDFYYRVSVETIELKPLKDRRDDIQVIFEYYVQIFGADFEIEEGVFEQLNRYHWPGNVRELVGVAKVLAMLGKRYGVVHIHDLPLKVVGASVHHGDSKKRSPTKKNLRAGRLSAAECIKKPESTRELLLLSLAKYRGNKSAIARAFGVSRSTLYRRMKELNILKS
jgi:DNA-binding NtrC family response regulator/tetratricopeptide (TPR) repeat protein